MKKLLPTLALLPAIASAQSTVPDRGPIIDIPAHLRGYRCAELDPDR